MENILFNKKTRVSFNLSLPTGHKLLTYTTHQAKQSRSPRARCESREPGSLSLACVSLRNKKQGWRLNAFFADVARRMLTRFCKVWVARIAVSTEAAIPLKKKNLPRIETRKQESPECLFSTVLKFYSSMLQFQKQKQKNVSMAHW